LCDLKPLRNTMKLQSYKLLFVLFLLPIFIKAQINKPSLSPRTVIEQQVGLAIIKLDYGKPNKQNRKIFGALIPYDKLWRTGANSSTKITFDQEVQLAGNIIPAGTYGLYSIPGAKEWTIIIHKNAKLWGAGGYDETNDLLRFKVPVTPLKDTVETLNIYFENFDANGGDLIIAWEHTKIVLPVFVDSDALILAEIDAKINSTAEAVSAATYFDAAQFYYLKNKQLETAAVWFEKAIDLRPEAYWYVYYRAELAYTLKDYKTAKEYATNCLKAARQSTSSDYGYIAKATLLLEQLENK